MVPEALAKSETHTPRIFVGGTEELSALPESYGHGEREAIADPRAVDQAMLAFRADHSRGRRGRDATLGRGDMASATGDHHGDWEAALVSLVEEWQCLSDERCFEGLFPAKIN